MVTLRSQAAPLGSDFAELPGAGAAAAAEGLIVRATVTAIGKRDVKLRTAFTGTNTQFPR